jgi:molybdopterin-binding protein
MIAIKKLRVNLGSFQLEDIELKVEQGEYFIILGPTGAGKTVLLEAIAGIHPIVQGEVWIGDREVAKLKPEKRGIGIVYQDQVLFPHLSAEKNIAFGLKVKKHPKQEIKPKVEAMAEMLGVSHLLERKPETLSGGEKQKVALARALVTEPEVLLLDEPLSAVDLETREQMQQELKEVHRRFGVTIIHVTHDFEEAVALGHRVAVLNQGRIAQVGTPEEVLRHPASEFVARFALSRNVFAGEAGDGEPGSATITIGDTKLIATTDLRGEVHLSLRPEDILISKEPLRSTARNSLPGVVTNVADRGAVIYVTVTVPPDFICLITRQSFEELELRKEMRVWITFKASAIHVF